MLVEDKMNFLILLLQQITNPSSPPYTLAQIIYILLYIYISILPKYNVTDLVEIAKYMN
ncbi:hypothetical protein B4118_4254 [Bacillus cereus]|nr:hypothetical protein bcere0023_22910 [Bacillus cereus Rock4-2]KZD60866.1 hypothetical protein B4118_4254 [Bacillus cereus]